MLKALVVLCSSLVLGTAAAQPGEDWLQAAESADGSLKTKFKRTSIEISRDESGRPWIGVIIQSTHTKKGSSEVDLYRQYVTVADCEAGVGQSYVRKLNGERLYVGDYVSGSSAVGNINADLLCKWLKVMQARNWSKVP